MRRNNRCPFDIFDKKDVHFRGFHGTMESVFQSLHSEGIGAEVKHIPLITKEEEATMWEKGVLGDLTLQALVRSVFFLNGKNFCLRGGVGDLCRENKVIRQYPCPDAGRACHVYLLDLYFSKLSEGAKEKGAFYFTPLRKTPADPKKPWFTDVPIGWNKLDRFV